MKEKLVKNLYNFKGNLPSTRGRLSPEKVQKLVLEVNMQYSRLSPSGCSKNMLASHSNIDSEIEYARMQVSPLSSLKSNYDQPCSTARPSNSQISTNKSVIDQINSITKQSHVLPALKLSPAKDTHTDKFLSFQPTKISVTPLRQSKSSRMKKIDKIIKNCNGLGREIGFEVAATERKVEKNRSYLKSAEKKIKLNDVEEGLIDRCKQNGFAQNDLVCSLMIAKTLKRNKKVWKQNHTIFMKSVDRIMNSIPLLKSN